ncbi:MAG: hypothetical protein KAI66_17750 [Lentisphaeria bacterium]|nr:hypothetical protein [Lentisphaeria bacterium]
MGLEVRKESTEFWHKLKVGAIAVLEDEQAVAESMASGAGAYGLQYTMERKLIVRQDDGLAEWLLFELVGEDRLWLMVKVVGSMLDLRLYFEQPDVFPAGSRADILRREDYWLFEEPEDPDDFEASDLEFALEIPWELEEEGEEFEVVYGLKPQGVLYGEAREEPQPEGMPEAFFAAVAEYQTPDECENPEILVLELGGVELDTEEVLPQGGFVQLLFGCPIAASDIDILPK